MSEVAALPPGEHPAHGADRHLAHHFSSLERQVDASRLGMWLFLCTEVLLFAGLFVGYAVYRFSFPAAFAASSRSSEIWAGTLNTVVLITSSLTVALAIHVVRTDRPRAAVICRELPGGHGCGQRAHGGEAEHGDGEGPRRRLEQDGHALRRFGMAEGLVEARKRRVRQDFDCLTAAASSSTVRLPCARPTR